MGQLLTCWTSDGTQTGLSANFLQTFVSVQKHVPECRASWVFIRVLGWPMLMKHPWFLCTWSTVSVRLWSWFFTNPPPHTGIVGFKSHFTKKKKKHGKYSAYDDGYTWRSMIRVPCRCSRVVASVCWTSSSWKRCSNDTFIWFVSSCWTNNNYRIIKHKKSHTIKSI